MKRTDPPRPPEHWLQSQRLALGLNLLKMKYPRIDPESQDYEERLSDYQELLLKTFEYLPSDDMLQCIHPATLRALKDIPSDSYWGMGTGQVNVVISLRGTTELWR